MILAWVKRYNAAAYYLDTLLRFIHSFYSTFESNEFESKEF